MAHTHERTNARTHERTHALTQTRTRTHTLTYTYITLTHELLNVCPVSIWANEFSLLHQSPAASRSTASLFVSRSTRAMDARRACAR